MAVPRNILVATDFSKFSVKTLSDAIDIASQSRARIHLLHVIDNQLYESGGEAIVEPNETIMKAGEDAKVEKAREKMEKQIAGAGTPKDIQISTEIKFGEPADVILKEQETKDIDLIMMGSHGHRSLSRNLVGPVTYSVVKSAPCSVLVVRP